jgi:hypothetical protein
LKVAFLWVGEGQKAVDGTGSDALFDRERVKRKTKIVTKDKQSVSNWAVPARESEREREREADVRRRRTS